MATGTGTWALERVLCATDFSDNAAAALDAAVAIARAVRAKLRVVHVAPLAVHPSAAMPGLPVPAGADTPGADLPAALERFASPAVAAGLETERVLCHGDPAEEIVREARHAAANLIVMGRRRHAGPGQLFAGSVAEGVAKSAPCPVMVVKPFPRLRGEKPRRALCALDLGETSPATVAHAAALANALQADLVALHVACGPGDGLPEPASAPDALQDAREGLAALVADARIPGGRVRQEVVLGAPREAILGAASESGADLVVVGSHGGGVLDRQFIGSTTLHLLRKADCDVLVVPAWVARRRPAKKETPALRSLGRA